MGRLWSHADFLKLWAGQSISEFGSQVSVLAIPWLAAVGLHVSPIEFSLLEVFGFLPFICSRCQPAYGWIAYGVGRFSSLQIPRAQPSSC